MPGTLALFVLRVLTTYLRSQNILWPTMMVGVIGTVSNVVGHVILLNVLNLGTDGSAIAQSSAFILMLGALIVYIFASKVYKDSWGGWSVEAFYDWGQFLYIGVAGMLMLFLSVFGMEIGSFLAGILSEVELAAQSILFNVEVIIFTIPFGFGIACNIRVAQLLGASDTKGAKHAAIIGLGIAATTVIFIGVLGTLFRHELPKVFSSEDDVILLTAEVFPWLFLTYVLDGMDVCFLGILRGCNRETIATIITFIAYYVIGLPVGVVLMFVVFVGLAGFWWGLIGGLTVGTVSLGIVLSRTDWKNEMKEARARAGTLDTKKDVEGGGGVEVYNGNHDGDSDVAEDENTALLTYRKFADLKTQKRLKRFKKIMCNPEISRSQLRLHITSLEFSAENNGKETQNKSTKVSTPFLVATRCLFVLTMCVTLVIGLVCRFVIIPPRDIVPSTIPCIPANITNHPLPIQRNVTLPFCP